MSVTHHALIENTKVISLNEGDIPNDLPIGITSMELDRQTYEALMANFSFHYVVNEENIIFIDTIAAARELKLKSAQEYFQSIDKFIVSSIDCRIEKQVLQNLYTDIQIQKDDIVTNGGGACGQPFHIEGLSEGVANDIPIASAEELVFKVRCYKRSCEIVLKGHIEAINLLTNEVAIALYEVELGYPLIPEITY